MTNSLPYTSKTPRAGNRALSTNHTEAGASKRERIPFQYYRDEPPVFAEGDTVKVKTPRKRKAKSTMVKHDTFTCEWGSVRLDKHPDIPARWAARIKPSGAVIALPAPKIAGAACFGANSGISEKQQIAHAQFVTFLERVNREIPLDSARLTIATWHSIIEHRLEKRAS